MIFHGPVVENALDRQRGSFHLEDHLALNEPQPSRNYNLLHRPSSAPVNELEHIHQRLWSFLSSICNIRAEFYCMIEVMLSVPSTSLRTLKRTSRSPSNALRNCSIIGTESSVSRPSQTIMASALLYISRILGRYAALSSRLDWLMQMASIHK